MEKNFLKSIVILLRILDLSINVAGIYFLFHKEWLLGIFLIGVSYFTFNNTAKLKHASNSLPNTLDIKKNEAVSSAILHGLTQSAILLILPAIVMFFHFSFKWYFAIPLGLITGPAITFSLFGISRLISLF